VRDVVCGQCSAVTSVDVKCEVICFMMFYCLQIRNFGV
jgi:hypothetical protein